MVVYNFLNGACGTEENNITLLIDKLSKFRQELKQHLPVPVSYLFEITTAVSLHHKPPVLPSSYNNKIRAFGGSEGTTISIPFVGQHSCFGHNSIVLKKLVDDLIASGDLYRKASLTPAKDKSQWGGPIKDVVLLLSCIRRVRTIFIFRPQARLTLHLHTPMWTQPSL